MKAVSSLSATIVACVFVLSMSRSDALPIKLRSPRDLEKYEFEFDGDSDSLGKAMDNDEVSVEIIDTQVDEDDGLGITPETTLGDLKSVQEETKILKDHYKLTPSRPDIIDRRQCEKIPGFGFANNPVLSVFGQFFGRDFHFKFSCREKCCTRMWSCDFRSCSLRCQRYTIRIWSRPSHSSTSFCCRVDGRTVKPFPTGECDDDLLCMA